MDPCRVAGEFLVRPTLFLTGARPMSRNPSVVLFAASATASACSARWRATLRRLFRVDISLLHVKTVSRYLKTSSERLLIWFASSELPEKLSRDCETAESFACCSSRFKRVISLSICETLLLARYTSSFLSRHFL